MYSKQSAGLQAVDTFFGHFKGFYKQGGSVFKFTLAIFPVGD